MSTPLGITSNSPGSQRDAESRAASETAIRRSIRFIRNPHTLPPMCIQPSPPEA
jgi:hypothetical protein